MPGLIGGQWDSLWELLDEATLEDLRIISRELTNRYKEEQRKIGRRKLAMLEEGSKVRIGQNIKPRYLSGLTGKVIEIKGSQVTVRLDCGPINRFRSGVVVFRNAGALEVV